MKLIPLLITSILFVVGLRTAAQPGVTTYIAPHIKTLRTSVDDNAERMPVIKLDGSESLNISFDDMNPEYRRYTYRIVHCDYEGNPTDELFESDYVSAVADEEVIEDYEPSQNTTVLYTHYAITIPNTHVRPLLSGNYCLIVSGENDEGEEVEVIKTYFGVVDQKVTIRPTCTTDTEIDYNASHQQVEMEINFGNLILRDPSTEVRTVVMQNRRSDNAVWNPRHTSQFGNTLKWEHSRELIFDAGNEYRKMEMISTRYPGLHGDNVHWFDPYYVYTLMEDRPRPNYLYDEDRDGLSVIRCEAGGDPDIEADYVLTHFTLDMDKLPNDEVYVAGHWTTGGFVPEFKMNYNDEAKHYEANILMKLGYYNYLYLTKGKPGDGRSHTAQIEGDYFQTENEYEFFVYYRPSGSRYWQLCGFASPIYRR